MAIATATAINPAIINSILAAFAAILAGCQGPTPKPANLADLKAGAATWVGQQQLRRAIIESTGRMHPIKREQAHAAILTQLNDASMTEEDATELLSVSQ